MSAGTTNLETINFDLALAAARTFTTVTGGGNLSLGGIISGAGAARALANPVAVNGDDFSLFAAGLAGQTGQLREADAAVVSAELAQLGADSAAPVAGRALVPEPGTIASLIGGLGLLVGFRRARHPVGAAR